jgi:hypothetical protein
MKRGQKSVRPRFEPGAPEEKLECQPSGRDIPLNFNFSATSLPGFHRFKINQCQSAVAAVPTNSHPSGYVDFLEFGLHKVLAKDTPQPNLLYTIHKYATDNAYISKYRVIRNHCVCVFMWRRSSSAASE